MLLRLLSPLLRRLDVAGLDPVPFSVFVPCKGCHDVDVRVYPGDLCDRCFELEACDCEATSYLDCLVHPAG